MPSSAAQASELRESRSLAALPGTDEIRGNIINGWMDGWMDILVGWMDPPPTTIDDRAHTLRTLFRNNVVLLSVRIILFSGDEQRKERI